MILVLELMAHASQSFLYSLLSGWRIYATAVRRLSDTVPGKNKEKSRQIFQNIENDRSIGVEFCGMIGILQAQDGAGMTENLQVIGRMKMSLQFIIGSSGSGKSCYAYQNIIEQAGLHPEKLFYVIVPEQFTMQTQKTLVEMSPGRGILNIDILSFERLAYRVLEEVGGDSRILLEETGKSMVLQKMVQQHGKELSYLGGQMRKAGYLDEVKSILSEFMQYDIRDSEIQEMIEDSGDRALLQMKLKDVAVLYQAFTGYLKDHYMTGEEVMDALEKALPFSEKTEKSV